MNDIITKKYILSDAYEEIMLKHLIGEQDLHNLVENEHGNFHYRHVALSELGAWRWLPAYQYRDLLCEYIFSKKKGIDFGGYFGPIYGRTEIVDTAYKHLKQISDISSESLDYVFSSHTLEHIEDMDAALDDLYRVLKEKGKIIIIVPAYTCKRWRPGVKTNSHKHTLSIDGNKYTRIDKKIKKAGFKIKICEYCGDNSIFIFGEKNG